MITLATGWLKLNCRSSAEDARPLPLPTSMPCPMTFIDRMPMFFCNATGSADCSNAGIVSILRCATGLADCAAFSAIGFGSGTRFCSIESEDAAQALLEKAFHSGINYFDTAGSYTRRGIERLSEKRLGIFSKTRRKEIFLATKIDPRDHDGALHSVETSLKFLQTDYLDLIQIHSLTNLDDLERIGGANGVLAAVRELKDQKVARFIGITGHNDGVAMAEALRRYDFDTVLIQETISPVPSTTATAVVFRNSRRDHRVFMIAPFNDLREANLRPLLIKL